MEDFLLLMWKPFLAALILTGIHVYLGLHVIDRGVIFVDLALAQIAALGTAAGFLFGFGFHDPESWWFSLAATILGAVIFSLTRARREKVPHEAVIGIVYVVSAAAAILILSGAAEGDEELRHMLVGNILLVETKEIVKMALLYAAIGVLHFAFRKPLLAVSTAPEDAYAAGLPVRRWDLFFYATFGVVVTSSVQIAGVLLVFTFLIVPAVSAIFYAERIGARLVFGWAMGAISSFLGISLSYFLDLPTGAAIVCTFGSVLLLLTAWKKLLGRR